MKSMAPKILPLLSVGLLSYMFQAQRAKPVADAEYAFAKTSRETNTVNAFRTFLADDAVMFRQGDAVDGKKLWEERKPDSTLLNWWPVVADASRSGDLGYTTGPYQFFNKRTDKTPAGNGFYCTIWQKQKNGEWKIKVDLGVRLESIQTLPSELVLVDATGEKNGSNVTIQKLDADYNADLNKESVSFNSDFLSREYRIHRPLIGPSINQTTPVKAAEAGKFKFQTIGGGEALSSDLAYSYGNVVRSDKNGDHKANYLRVWKMQDRTWRIVLDVLTEG